MNKFGMNDNQLLFAYTIILVVVMYIWNPTDADGVTRWGCAVLIIIFGAIFGAAKRAALGIDLSEIKEEE